MRRALFERRRLEKQDISVEVLSFHDETGLFMPYFINPEIGFLYLKHCQLFITTFDIIKSSSPLLLLFILLSVCSQFCKLIWERSSRPCAICRVDVV